MDLIQRSPEQFSFHEMFESCTKNKLPTKRKIDYNCAVIRGLVAQRLAQATHNRLVKFKNKGPMAQWLAQGTHNSLVAGSNPAGPTLKIGVFAGPKT